MQSSEKPSHGPQKQFDKEHSRFSAIPQLNPDPRAQAYANGALAQMGNLGNLTGTVILLWLLDQLGQMGLIIFGLACYAAGLAVHMWLERRRKPLTHAARH
jgi:MFS transporter, DHA1 family, inner membrane transport protein